MRRCKLYCLTLNENKINILCLNVADINNIVLEIRYENSNVWVIIIDH